MTAKIKTTATHPSGKVLRTGDKVMVYGFVGEFVGIYKGVIMVYVDDAKCISDHQDWNHVNIYNPPSSDDKAINKLFEIEA